MKEETYCDIFSIPETEHLPASYELLHSFCLWATPDPSTADTAMAGDVPFEPVLVQVAGKYLAAIRAWHLAQGWPPPLSEDRCAQITWLLRGLANIQQHHHTRPPRPPVTLHMLSALKDTLNLEDPFEACIWAIAASAFWGLMWFGEATVTTRNRFNAQRYLTRANTLFSTNLGGNEYARLDLPSAKTAKPGEIQHIFLVKQGTLCPLDALKNLAKVVPVTKEEPLFCWRDRTGSTRPMVHDTTLKFISERFTTQGMETTFSHSFRIGGASFYLSQKVDPEVVRIMGRWRSLAYQVYIRAFKQVASRHTANLTNNYGL